MNEEISATGRDEEERDKKTLRGEGREFSLPFIPCPGTLHFFFVNLKHHIVLNHQWP